MKKIYKFIFGFIALLILIVTIYFISKSISSFSTNMALNKDALITKSESYANEFIQGDLKTIRNNFSSNLGSLISPSQLKDAWDQVVSTSGTVEKVIGSKFKSYGNDSVVTTELACKSKNLVLIFSYDKDKKLNGIHINFSPNKNKSVPTNANTNYKESPIHVGTYNLNGVLTLPSKTTPSKVAILVQGSGPSDMDENIAGNKPFSDLAHGLAEKGIASIRYNKRYEQFPYLSLNDPTIQTEVLNDVSSAIKNTQNLPSISKCKIIIIGHSLGGMLAPEIAKENQNISGVIMMAGSPRTLEDIIFDQLSAITNADPNQSKDQKIATINNFKNQITKIKKLKPGDPNVALPGSITMPTSYWVSINAIHTPDICKNLSMPILILQGKNDIQVYPNIDFLQWKNILKDKNNVTFKLYDNLNHLFMPTTNTSGNSDYSTPNHMDQEVINDIGNWINKI